MSFDLAVMNIEKPLTSSEATEIYHQLCEGNYDALPPSEKIDAFYQELTQQYPDMESYSDDDIDDCKWSVDLDVSDGAVVMSMVWSASEKMVNFITNLAEKHDLALYDPQDETVYLPASIRN
jgi:hypothetical protein